MEKSRGTLTSPNYPESYPVSTICEWVIYVEKEHIAVLEFPESFSFDGRLENCVDYLRVRNINNLFMSVNLLAILIIN